MTLAVGFQCNNACPGCLIKPWVNRWESMDRDVFRSHVSAHGEAPRFDRLILSGGEVTLEPDLPELVRFARRAGGFKRIRIQTNGRRLGEPGFLDRLIEAGVDEFYISLRGHNAALDRRSSGSADAFEEVARGLAEVHRRGVTWIANIVATSETVSHLSDIAERAVKFGVARVELYGFVPMTSGQSSLIPEPARLAREVRRCLTGLEAASVEVATSWIPLCLLGAFASRASSLPETTIGDPFWTRFPETACFFERVCGRAGECDKLPVPYIHRFGWQEELLQPYPTPSRSSPSHRQTTQPSGSREDWTSLLAGPDGEVTSRSHLWRFLGVVHEDGGVVFRFQTGATPFTLRLSPRAGREAGTLPDEAHVRGFRVSLQAPGVPRRIRMRLMLELLAIIERNDDGRLVL